MDLAAAQALYDNSLAKLMEKVREGRRGIYRVMMAPEGLIKSVNPIRVSARPCPSSFSVFIPEKNGKWKPRFGTLDMLDESQKSIAQALENDMNKLLRASEVAFALQSGASPVLDAHVKNRVDELTSRFGELPEPALKAEDERKRKCLAEQEALQREREQIWQEIQPSIFENLLQHELELERQRQHRSQLAASSSSAATGTVSR